MNNHSMEIAVGPGQESRAMREASPDEAPWLRREDWAAGGAKGGIQNPRVFLIIASGALALLILAAFAGRWDAAGPLGAVFVIFAVLSAWYMLRWRRFGPTYFECDSMPCVPGTLVTGRIHVPRNVAFEQGVTLQMQCVRVVSDSDSSKSIPLWSGKEARVTGPALNGPEGVLIPVSLPLPAKALETYEGNGDSVRWQLKVRALHRGVNYSDQFELPVFHAAAGSSKLAPAADAPAFSIPDQKRLGPPPQRANQKPWREAVRKQKILVACFALGFPVIMFIAVFYYTRSHEAQPGSASRPSDAAPMRKPLTGDEAQRILKLPPRSRVKHCWKEACNTTNWL